MSKYQIVFSWTDFFSILCVGDCGKFIIFMREEGLILEVDYKQCEIEITLHCECQFRGGGGGGAGG